ncbi:hypothetical protein [Psychrobacter frigidicola]|uniref:hypothetical protein n=1 Tax=Psychrobacter frigidicola TaxID=45611 RepID=UPI00191ABFC5|nr:hypothetical protein [Psychrobacter frigidicola]
MSLKETLKQAKKIERQLERQNESTPSSQSLGTTKLRNYLTLNPLLRKGGIHEKEDVDIVLKKCRRETKQNLRQTDWLLE